MEPAVLSDHSHLDQLVVGRCQSAQEIREPVHKPTSSRTETPLPKRPVALWETLANWADVVATRKLPADETPVSLY